MLIVASAQELPGQPAGRFRLILTTMLIASALLWLLACGSETTTDVRDAAEGPQTLNAMQQEAQQVLAERLSVSANDLALVTMRQSSGRTLRWDVPRRA